MVKSDRTAESDAAVVVERVQTGVRIEKRILKVLKALAEYHDLTLGDLLEGIVLHAFEGKCAFKQENLARIADLKKIYELDLDASHSHRLKEPTRRAGGREAR
jgi:predicted DNA-binding ribbon-helix-helix protein